MKFKVLLFSLLGVLALTGCGTNPDSSSQGGSSTSGDSSSQGGSSSQTVNNQVTKEEWSASIGMEKPFLFADNYKFNMLAKMNGVDFAEENFYADGNKFKDEPVKAPQGESLGPESYYSFENSKYVAYQFTGGKWSTHETSSTPIHSIIQTSLAPFGNPNLFTYDETSKSYKCETTTIGVTFTNLEIKFVDKKIKEASFTVEGVDYICFLIYGGQTVTLPEIDPEPSGKEYKVTENQFNAAFTLEGLNNVTITTSSGSFSQTCEADGTKEFNVNMKSYDFYLSLEDGIMYEYKQEDSEWVKNQREGTTFSRVDMIKMFGNVYNQLAFDDDSNSYKGTNISIEGAVRYSEVEYCFENSKVVAIHAIGATGSAAGQSMKVNFTKYGQTVVTLPEIDPEPVPPGPDADAKYKVTSEQYDAAIGVEAFNNVSVYDTNEYLCYKFDGDNEEVFIYGHAILSHEDDTWYIYTESGGSWSRAVTQNPQSGREDLVYLLSSFDYDSLEYDETSHSYICLDESILSNFGMTYATFGFENGVLLYWIMGNQQSSSGMIFTAYGTTAIDIPTVE